MVVSSGQGESTLAGFDAFVLDAEPRLRSAFTAAYGPDRGRDAALAALAYAWQHWDRMQTLDNRLGYLYRVGQTQSRPRPPAPLFPAGAQFRDPWVEPGLPAALEKLSEREREVVVLCEAYQWTVREVAELIGVSASSVQSYLERGLRKLRDALGVESHD